MSVFAPGSPLREPGVEAHGLGGADLFGWPGASARLFASPWLAPRHAQLSLRVRRRLARESDFDLAYAHWLVPSVWPWATSLPAPVEGIAHGADVRLLLRLPVIARATLMQRVMSRVRRLRFVAQASLDALASSLPSQLASDLRERAHVAPMPIDVLSREKLPSRSALGLPERYVAWVGRLVPDKRVALAIAAAELARVPLVLVGDGPTAPRTSANLQWLGARPREEALSVIAHAEALLHTSANEAAPTVVREARALGVRVLACRAGDIEAWANDDPGVEIVPDSVEAIADALRRLR